jgi:hypothetical protein
MRGVVYQILFSDIPDLYEREKNKMMFTLGFG